ncbi:MAG: IMP cyclohydrolase [Patescibacteria group bacterium]
MDTSINAEASNNFNLFASNPYPGRFILIGRDSVSGNLVQVYGLTGRSENSRNRVFSSDDDGRLFTEAADPAKVKDPSLIIYNAMLETVCDGKKRCIVSNGDQTDSVIAYFNRGENNDGDTLVAALQGRQYEPDQPNFTPRITGMCFPAFTKHITLSVLRKSVFNDSCDRCFYHYVNIPAGYGMLISTYSGDGNPLPSFRGEPMLMPLKGDPTDILETYWGALNEANRVALAVKIIDAKTGVSEIRIKNKLEKVSAPTATA